jgi:hypothetical protein
MGCWYKDTAPVAQRQHEQRQYEAFRDNADVFNILKVDGRGIITKQ